MLMILFRLDWRMHLNNYLSVNGGTDRLRWETSQTGPAHAPIWTAIAMS